MAKTENIIEIENEKIASFGGKYATSKMLIIGKYKIKMHVLDKIVRSNYFIAKTDQGEYRINSSLIRYIQVLNEMHCFKYHTDHQ
ncbi:hypothetical protein [Peribacillus sp. NPDC096540]|uniref:hypothetical protein n=1 Tax=Peribacillus sp. NPDC096540 TaxID=3390612 RepID=UPI003CFCE9B0